MTSNLYMTTEEFAAMVIEVLHEHDYFKRGAKAHPQDLAYAFSSVGETIGDAMYWAIQREHEAKKQAVMQPRDLQKTHPPTSKFDKYWRDGG